jgi:hypothetical protein
MNLLKPELRWNSREEESPRVSVNPAIPVFTERRKAPRPTPPVRLPAPPPWPQGQFRIDPEA